MFSFRRPFQLSQIQWTATRLQLLLRWWPPYALGPAIRVDTIRDDFRYARVQLPLRWYNTNYVGTHFGGSLYSMCDPMYMLLLLNALDREDFVVWDKSAQIRYRKPGRGTVTAEFRLDDALVESLNSMGPGETRDVDLPVDVKDGQGDVVASLIKTLYVRRKDRCKGEKLKE